MSAFGGIVSSNRIIDLATAQEIYKTHFDAIVAPRYEEEALALLQRKKDMRIISLDVDITPTGRAALPGYPPLRGGMLVQTPDFITEKEFSRRRSPSGSPHRRNWKTCSLPGGW